MPGFKTHITASTVLGVGYGAAGAVLMTPPEGQIPWASCVLAGGLCSVSGMLPDLDSDSGRPIREITLFGAAVVPMLMMNRFTHMGLSHEEMVLAGAGVYASIRFGFSWMLKKFTVHRGMFHSIPAALIAALLAFLVCACDDLALRYYRAGAVLLGFCSHLLLDEINSFEMKRGRIRIKKSFGTAMKFWGTSGWANLSTYLKLVVLAVMAFGDPILMEKFEQPGDHLHTIQEGGQNLHKSALESIEKLWR